jgi:hypothetical protein
MSKHNKWVAVRVQIDAASPQDAALFVVPQNGKTPRRIMQEYMDRFPGAYEYSVEVDCDAWGRQYPGMTLCPVCGQPDDCGDCNHGRLSDDDVRAIGGRVLR